MAQQNKYKNILVQVNGGTGKNIAFGMIAKELKEQYEHVSVISPYVDVYQCNPYIDKAYPMQEVKSAFEDAADDTFIVIDHIYDTDEFIRKEISYADAFRKLCGLPYKTKTLSTAENDFLTPEVQFPQLVSQVEAVLNDLRGKGYNSFILFQHTGGQTPLVQVPAKKNDKGQMEADWSQVPYNGQNSGLSRHYPTDKAAEFVKLFREQHKKTAVVSFSLPNEPYIEGTERYVIPYLAYYLLAKDDMCTGMVGIDSSLQHLLAGVAPAVVMWHHSLPLSFGYDYNRNIIANCHRDGIKYFSALGPAGNRIDYTSPEELLSQVDEYLYKETTHEDHE